MLNRTMKDIDEKILKYFHDYSRIKGEKLKINRENMEKNLNIITNQTIIKIEDNATYGSPMKNDMLNRNLNDTSTNDLSLQTQ